MKIRVDICVIHVSINGDFVRLLIWEGGWTLHARSGGTLLGIFRTGYSIWFSGKRFNLVEINRKRDAGAFRSFVCVAV